MYIYKNYDLKHYEIEYLNMQFMKYEYVNFMKLYNLHIIMKLHIYEFIHAHI